MYCTATLHRTVHTGSYVLHRDTTPLRPHITYTLHQNSPRHCTKHHSAQAKQFNSQDFNHYPFFNLRLYYYKMLTENIVIFNCYGVTATQLNEFVPLYYCDNNITLRMVSTAAETC